MKTQTRSISRAAVTFLAAAISLSIASANPTTKPLHFSGNAQQPAGFEFVLTDFTFGKDGATLAFSGMSQDGKFSVEGLGTLSGGNVDKFFDVFYSLMLKSPRIPNLAGELTGITAVLMDHENSTATTISGGVAKVSLVILGFDSDGNPYGTGQMSYLKYKLD